MEGSRALGSPPCCRPVCSSRSPLCLEAPHKTVLNAVERGDTSNFGVSDLIVVNKKGFKMFPFAFARSGGDT